MCKFLLAINSNNLGTRLICHRFRDTATYYSLKLSTKNCDQTVADEDMVTIVAAYRQFLSPYPTAPSPIP